MPKSSNVTPPKKAAPAAVTKKTQRIHNVSGSGFEVILLIDGLWEHFWLNPGDAISVPKVPLSLTAILYFKINLLK